MRALIALIVASIVLISCTQKYALDSYQAPQQRLPANSSIYVMIPANGSYGGRIFPNSGQQTAQALYASLSAVTSKIALGSGNEPLDSAMTAAKSNGVDYIFQPFILNWEDRATGWSGIPDRITIKIIVHEVASGKDIASVLARVSSEAGPLGGGRPQDLLPRVMNEFTTRVF